MSTIPLPPTLQQALAAAIEHHRAGRLAQAEALYRQVLAADDKSADTWSNLGFCLIQKNDLHRAESACRRAIELNPDLANAHANLGNALLRQARSEEAAVTLRTAIALNPNLRVAHENLLLALSYLPSHAPQDVYAEHLAWAQRHANHRGDDAPPHANDRDPDRRLRIGYVSPDFRQHPVAFFIEPLIAAHDRAHVEVFCYSDVERADEATHRIKRAADQWRDARGVTDDRFAQLVRDDRIDVLVDLAGHTAGNRLLAFAYRPAPVQMTYLGYPNTTGLSAIGFRITDALADPPGVADAFYSERLIRLPRTAWCYRPPAQAPPVAPEPPSTAAGNVTFASFNKLAKISPPCIDTWAELLRATPTSRMIIKSTALGDEIARRRLADAFAARGVDRARLEVLGPTVASADHLAIYARADVALDTFPYHGTTTTCDALYMGAAVVTLAGQTHVSRVGVSLLHVVGLEDLVAQTPQQYVAIAANLAADRDRLAQLRIELRPRMQSSPLMDARGLAREIESAMRQCWQRWCSSAAPV